MGRDLKIVLPRREFWFPTGSFDWSLKLRYCSIVLYSKTTITGEKFLVNNIISEKKMSQLQVNCTAIEITLKFGARNDCLLFLWRIYLRSLMQCISLRNVFNVVQDFKENFACCFSRQMETHKLQRFFVSLKTLFILFCCCWRTNNFYKAASLFYCTVKLACAK